MTIGSLFGGQTTPSILDRFDPASTYPFQGQAFTPFVDRGGHEPEWTKSKSDSKGKTAMSALTLLAFLFFLNMLMSCLKETIANNQPEVVIMQQRAARKARALDAHFRPKGDLGEDVHAENAEEIDMDQYEAAGDYEPEVENFENSVAEKTNRDVGEDDVDADFNVGNVVDNPVDTNDFEKDETDTFSADGSLLERDAEEVDYETSLEKPETSEKIKVVHADSKKMPKDVDNEVGLAPRSETLDAGGPEEIIATIATPHKRRGNAEDSVWRRALAAIARPFIRRTFDVSLCKELVACETSRIAGMLGKSSVADGFGEMLDWLFEESQVPQLWLDAALEGRSKDNCRGYIDKCTLETKGVSMLPMVAFFLEQFI